MKARFAIVSAVASLVGSLVAGAPAFAQFAPASGAGAGLPSLSGAGTGLSAPSTIRPGGTSMADPNAIEGMGPPAAPAAPALIYPGVGIGGVGLPPGAFARQRAAARQAAAQRRAATPH